MFLKKTMKRQVRNTNMNFLEMVEFVIDNYWTPMITENNETIKISQF